jgi:hypothetical protein
VSGALLSALGGNLNVTINAEHGFGWNEAVCADRDDRKSKNAATTLSAFDRDFYKNVLTPACATMKKDHPNLNLNCKGWENVDARTQLDQDGYLESRKVLALEGCDATNKGIVDGDYRLSFVAPREWGFAQGQKAYLYRRNTRVADVWDRDTALQITGYDTQKCGNRVLKVIPPAAAGATPAAPAPGAPVQEDEVCVYAKVTKTWLSFDSDCKAIAKAGTKREFGITQTSDAPEDKTIQYRLP